MSDRRRLLRSFSSLLRKTSVLPFSYPRHRALKVRIFPFRAVSPYCIFMLFFSWTLGLSPSLASTLRCFITIHRTPTLHTAPPPSLVKRTLSFSLRCLFASSITISASLWSELRRRRQLGHACSLLVPPSFDVILNQPTLCWYLIAFFS